MNVGRILSVCSALALATAAYGATKYERALDGKTKVWHNSPQSRVKASWSGDRDEQGYATGGGTLTWFRTEQTWLTGSLLPTTRYIEVSQYTGKMVDGKLEGQVTTVDAKGNSFHAKYADGRKVGQWIAGPAKTRKATDEDTSTIKVAEARPQPSSAPAEPPPPAEAPPPAPKLDQHVAAQPVEKPAEPSGGAERATDKAPESAAHSEDSLQSLAMPPSSLRVASLTATPNRSSAPPPDVGQSPAAAEAAPIDSSTSSPTSLKNDDARAVAALDSEYHTAVKTNDASTLDRILADDFVLVHGAGPTLTKTDMLKHARDKQAKYEHHEVDGGTQKVRVWRDTAVVTETVWVKGSEAGKPLDQKMSVTATYVRTPNGWRYVSGQSTPTK